MTTRSADATIRGYYYQFDKTIIEILDASPADTIVVERIEDIDVDNPAGSKAIQCKYIPSAKYLPSSIRPAVVLMLDNHFERSKISEPPISYRLYAHFSDGTPGDLASPPFTLDEFKELLTFTEKGVKHVFHTDNGISDAVLSSFLGNLIIEVGPSFEAQQARVLESIKKECSCNEVDADVLFYNNALRVVRDLAINPKLAERQITKADFLARINVKNAVFNAWYLELRGEDAYRKLVRQQIRVIDALGAGRERMIVLDHKLVTQQPQQLTVSRFIERLGNIYFKRGKTFSNDLPVTIVLQATVKQMAEVKRALLRAGIAYNDGYEDLEFQPAFFNAPPVVNKEKVGNKASNKLGKSSYQVKLLRADTYRTHAADIFVPEKAILFTDDDPKLYFPDVEPMHITAQARDLDEIFKILS